MKSILCMAFAALVSTAATAQNEQERNNKGFTSLEVQDGIQVIFTQSDVESVKVTSNGNSNLNFVVTESRGEKLAIYLNENIKNTETEFSEIVKVYVSDNNIVSITAQTGASVYITNQVDVPAITFNIKSGAAIKGIINAHDSCTIKAASGAAFNGSIITKRLNTDITGGAHINAYGSAEKTVIFCSGGTFNAGKFVTDHADIIARRVSSVAVNVKISVMANADNTSAITYSGNPEKIKMGDDTFAIRRK